MLNPTELVLILAAAVLATVVVIGIGIAIGFRFGLVIGGRTVISPHQIEPPSDCERELVGRLNQCQHLMGAVQQRGIALARVTEHYRGVAPPILLLAIDQLTEKTSALGTLLDQQTVPLPSPAPATVVGSTRIESASRTETPASQSSTETVRASCATTVTAKGDTATTHGAERLTADEMQALAGSTTQRIDDSPKQRFPYNCFQTVVPLDDEPEQQDISRAATVHCHDVSVQGVSFLWPDVPDFERLKISLGTPEKPILMLAEVAHSKTVFMYDEVQVLIDARFIGRYSSPQNGELPPKVNQLAAREKHTVGV